MKWLKPSFGRLLCKICRWISDVWHHASPIPIYKFFDEDLQMRFDGRSCGWADGCHVFSPPLQYAQSRSGGPTGVRAKHILLVRRNETASPVFSHVCHLSLHSGLF